MFINRQMRRHPIHPSLQMLYPSKESVISPNESRRNKSVNPRRVRRRNDSKNS